MYQSRFGLSREARLALTDARRDARLIMIAEHPVRPTALRQRPLVFIDQLGDRIGGPSRLYQREVERKVRAGKILTIVGDEALDRQVNLADQNALVIFIEHAAHLGDHLMYFRLVGGVHLLEPPDLALTRRPARIRRIVAQLGILNQMPDHIDTKTVDAAVEPEAQHIVHRLAHCRIAPIEVGLLAQEGVVIVLSRRRIEAPGWAAEIADPIARR